MPVEGAIIGEKSKVNQDVCKFCYDEIVLLSKICSLYFSIMGF